MTDERSGPAVPSGYTATPEVASLAEVGVRELRNGLSKWLARVRAGEEVVVTERGKPIARIEPVDRRSRYDELVAAGVITPARVRPQEEPLAEPIAIKGAISEFVQAQRR